MHRIQVEPAPSVSLPLQFPYSDLISNVIITQAPSLTLKIWSPNDSNIQEIVMNTPLPGHLY